MSGWTRVTEFEKLPSGQGILVEWNDKRLALFRVEESVYALGDRCSHAEASLAEGDVFETEVECPRHGAAFDMTTGEALTLPASKPVPTYETKIEDGTVFVRLEQE